MSLGKKLCIGLGLNKISRLAHIGKNVKIGKNNWIGDNVKIYEEEKRIIQNIETQNVDIVDLSKNNYSTDNSLKKIIIFIFYKFLF